MNFEILPHGRYGNPKIGCVYEIVNTVNGNSYIGGTTKARMRVKLHFSQLRRGVHNNKKMQTDYNKYGEDAFIINVLKIIVSNRRKSALPSEIGFIRERSPFYNIRYK